MSAVTDRIAAIIAEHREQGWHALSSAMCSCGDSGAHSAHLAEAVADGLQLTHEWVAGGPGVWLSRERAAQHAKYYGTRLRARLVTPWVEEQP